MRRFKTIANALLGDIGRKLSPYARERLEPELELYSRAVNQKRTDKDKIYSLHEPEVFCIAKCKEHKKYEFGNKVALAQTISSGIIVGAQNAYNEYDGHCLPDLLKQISAITGRRPERAFCDRGFRGKTRICGTEIELPYRPKKNATAHYKRRAQEKFRRRSAIEATNSHLKHGFSGCCSTISKGQLGTQSIFCWLPQPITSENGCGQPPVLFLRLFLPGLFGQD